MTKSEVIELVSRICDAWPAARMTPDTARVYCECLVDLEHDAARAAVDRLIATSKWAPTIAEVRSASVSDSSESAELAWASVIKAVRTVGVHRKPSFSDPATVAAVAAMGWRSICSAREDMAGASRAHFVKAYQAAKCEMQGSMNSVVFGKTKDIALLGSASGLLSEKNGKDGGDNE